MCITQLVFLNCSSGLLTNFYLRAAIKKYRYIYDINNKGSIRTGGEGIFTLTTSADRMPTSFWSWEPMARTFTLYQYDLYHADNKGSVKSAHNMQQNFKKTKKLVLHIYSIALILFLYFPYYCYSRY